MTRVRGVAAPRGLGAGEHVGWAYADEDDWRVALGSFLHEGADRGERLMYNGWDGRSADELMGDLVHLPHRDRLRESGALGVYPDDAALAGDLTGRLPELQGAAEAARADGYRGLRASSDVSPLLRVRGPAYLAGFELACDRMFAGTGVVAMCGIDRRDTPAPALATELMVHPLRRPGGPLDRCWLTAPRGGAGPWLLSGDLDDATAAPLSAVAARLPGDRELHLDLRDLGFVDTVGTRVLLDLASTRSGVTVLHCPSLMLRELLDAMAPVTHPELATAREDDTVRLGARGEARTR